MTIDMKPESQARAATTNSLEDDEVSSGGTISGREAHTVNSVLESNKSSVSAGKPPEEVPPKDNIEFDDEDYEESLFEQDGRLEFGFRNDETFMRLWTYASIGLNTPLELGYTSAHGGDDRSLAESILLQKLLFYLQGEGTKALGVMNRLSPPKWSESSRTYKKSILASARGVLDGVFDPNESSSGTGGVERDTAVRVVSTGVLDGILTEPTGRFKTKEASNHEEVGVTKRHVQKVLNALDDANYLRHEQDGRSSNWVCDDLLMPTGGSEFYHQFRTREEVNQQRTKWMQMWSD